MMKSRRCAACGKAFRPHPQIPKQRYCAAFACQRSRRQLWQQQKRQNDPDYQDNQARAQRAWRQRNPDYWREYRCTHPEYLERNRERQRERNRERRGRPIAKMDVSTPVSPLPSGIYQISRMPLPGIAKMDAWTVQITVLSTLSDLQLKHCKERT